ncbi:NfeD family protein [Planctomicrobium piriforme]|uniref:Membrane protein implicated in regulation of membrane protease activity n=1 Tax=Planctomicrobium piriforme TaxID=1576369 RepID=A0A1I3G772_9PLAN|nr:NfeD family protein [Planctomicrobium piriforme]SFI19326.1 Membrane protein implicated in regulation of membrane protease activity [Planctomicrobium piriforme]
METLFLICALSGGTFIACQFVLTLLGLSDSFFSADVDHELAGDIETDLHDGIDHVEADGHAEHHSSWLFGVISLRTLIAATTFFGLAGMAVNRGGGTQVQQLAFATVSGAAALFGVHWLMKSFYQLGQNSTLRMQNAVGKIGTVSLAIPGDIGHCGKVQVEIQGRLEEVAAIAVEAKVLPTGSRVQVVGISHGNVLEVAAVKASTRSERAVPI